MKHDSKRKMIKKHAKSAKSAKRAKYAGFAEAGQKKNSKRYRQNHQKNKLVKTYAHGSANCGNPGCKRCFAHLYV